MDINHLLEKHGRQLFSAHGQEKGQCYMVLDDTIIYVQQCDRHIAEGKSVNQIRPLIQRIFSLS